MPHSCQHETYDDNVFGKAGRGKELTHGEEVGYAGNSQGNDEGRLTQMAELARADGQRNQHDETQKVEPARRREAHKSVLSDFNCPITCRHSANHAAVCGDLAGATRSSSSRRTKSDATSMS